MRLRAPTREERQLAWLWAVVAGCSALLWPFWLALAPLVPPCPFRAITGVPCPTCGTTHAAVALLGGRPGAALLANPLMTVVGAAFLVGGAVAPVWATLKLPVPEIPTPLPRWVRLAIVAVVLASWSYLIVKS